MDDKDLEYLDGFNLGYELEKTVNDRNIKAKDKRLIQIIEKSLRSIQDKNDRLEGIQEGRKAFVKELMLKQEKDKQKSNEKERER